MVSQLRTARGGGLKLPSSRAGGAFGGAGWGIVVGSRGFCRGLSAEGGMGRGALLLLQLVGVGEPGHPRRGGTLSPVWGPRRAPRGECRWLPSGLHP